MQSNVPAEAFRRAAIKKRKDRDAEAEESSKRSRSQSTSGPHDVPRVPIRPPPTRRSPIQTPPSRQSPMPTPSPHQSPMPTPPPRRSPTPLPPRKSPSPLPPQGSPAPLPSIEPTSLTVGPPLEESGALIAPPAEISAPPTHKSASGGTPPTGKNAPTDRKQKAVAGGEAHAATSDSSGAKMGPIPMRPSIMNHPHLAEKLLSAASNSAIREEIRRTSSRTVFKECQAALLRVVNVFNHTQNIAINGERQLGRYRREAQELRNRVTAAEDALKLARAGEEERLEIVRSQARAESEAAQAQMRIALERALTAEGRLIDVEAERADSQTQLEVARSDLKSAEEKTEIAEAVARLADIRVAEATAAVQAAEKRSAEAEATAKAAEEKVTAAAENAIEGYRGSQAFKEEVEKAAVQIAEKKAASIAEKAVDTYRGSPAFIEEMAGAGADAYLHGFYECRSVAVRLFGIEGLGDLEPGEDSENEENAPSSAPVGTEVPSTDTDPADN